MVGRNRGRFAARAGDLSKGSYLERDVLIVGKTTLRAAGLNVNHQQAAEEAKEQHDPGDAVISRQFAAKEDEPDVVPSLF